MDTYRAAARAGRDAEGVWLQTREGAERLSLLLTARAEALERRALLIEERVEQRERAGNVSDATRGRRAARRAHVAAARASALAEQWRELALALRP